MALEGHCGLIKGCFMNYKNVTIIGNTAGFCYGLIDISRQNGTISRWCCINVIPLRRPPFL